MALVDLRREENVPGEFYVDASCIDCDLCRQIAPSSFHAAGEQSAVYRQPSNPEEELAALKALVTCPTASIGTLSKKAMGKAVNAFPEEIEEGVFFCGYAAESSYGASSYLIVRPEGNVLVDSPRFARPLVRRISELGGVRHIFLTHRDDVADQELWAREFSADRIIHEADAGHLRDVAERLLTGRAPASLAPDLLAIPTPGHTSGHVVLLYNNKFLFTGDHIWWSDRYKGLHASRNVNWYSWPEQVRSVRLLLDYAFEWVLPGHGRRAHAGAAEMREMLEACIQRISPRAS